MSRGIREAVKSGPIHGSWTWPPCVWPAMTRSIRESSATASTTSGVWASRMRTSRPGAASSAPIALRGAVSSNARSTPSSVIRRSASRRRAKRLTSGDDAGPLELGAELRRILRVALDGVDAERRPQAAQQRADRRPLAREATRPSPGAGRRGSRSRRGARAARGRPPRARARRRARTGGPTAPRSAPRRRRGAPARRGRSRARSPGARARRSSRRRRSARPAGPGGTRRAASRRRRRSRRAAGRRRSRATGRARRRTGPPARAADHHRALDRQQRERGEHAEQARPPQRGDHDHHVERARDREPDVRRLEDGL